MNRSKSWRVLALLLVLGIFVARMYVTAERKEKQEEQKRLIDDLSRMQMEERAKEKFDLKEVIGDSTKIKLEETKKSLDSIGKSLKERQEAFNPLFMH